MVRHRNQNNLNSFRINSNLNNNRQETGHAPTSRQRWTQNTSSAHHAATIGVKKIERREGGPKVVGDHTGSEDKDVLHLQPQSMLVDLVMMFEIYENN